MNINKKIARMGMGYDKYHVQHDPNISCGEAELLAKEETQSFILKQYSNYIDKLSVFHYDAMEFLRSLDVYSNSDRLEQVKKLQALLKLGEEIEVSD